MLGSSAESGSRQHGFLFQRMIADGATPLHKGGSPHFLAYFLLWGHVCFQYAAQASLSLVVPFLDAEREVKRRLRQVSAWRAAMHYTREIIAAVTGDLPRCAGWSLQILGPLCSAFHADERARSRAPR